MLREIELVTFSGELLYILYMFYRFVTFLFFFSVPFLVSDFFSSLLPIFQIGRPLAIRASRFSFSVYG